MQPGDVDELIFDISERVGAGRVPGAGEDPHVFGGDLPGFPRPGGERELLQLAGGREAPACGGV